MLVVTEADGTGRGFRLGGGRGRGVPSGLGAPAFTHPEDLLGPF